MKDIEEIIENVKNMIKESKKEDERFFFNRNEPHIKTDSLKKLRNTLVSLKNDPSTDLNQKFKLSNVLDTQTINCLNIAVIYCEPAVVEFLLLNGAKANSNTIHFATTTLWSKRHIDETLDLLVKHGVDLNAPRDGQTALYYLNRRPAHEYKQFMVIRTSLINHGGTMTESEVLWKPFQDIQDSVCNTYKKITGFSPFPH